VQDVEAGGGLEQLAGEMRRRADAGGGAQSQIGGGTVRGVAVTSREPSPLVPGVPAIAQSGLPGFEVIG
jgi:tripartite-type tricarboxylate transporter receptor subunit TctC